MCGVLCDTMMLYEILLHFLRCPLQHQQPQQTKGKVHQLFKQWTWQRWLGSMKKHRVWGFALVAAAILLAQVTGTGERGKSRARRRRIRNSMRSVTVWSGSEQKWGTEASEGERWWWEKNAREQEAEWSCLAAAGSAHSDFSLVGGCVVLRIDSFELQQEQPQQQQQILEQQHQLLKLRRCRQPRIVNLLPLEEASNRLKGPADAVVHVHGLVQTPRQQEPQPEPQPRQVQHGTSSPRDTQLGHQPLIFNLPSPAS